MERTRIIKILTLSFSPIVIFAVALYSVNQYWFESEPEPDLKAEIKKEQSAPTAQDKMASLSQAGQEIIASVVPDEELHNSAEEEYALHPVERIRALDDKTTLQSSILSDYDEFKQYPAHNTRIHSAKKDPVTKRFETDVRSTSNDDRTEILTVWSEQSVYQRGDTIRVFAELRDHFGRTINSRFKAQLIYQNTEDVYTFDLADSNADGSHEYSFMLDQINGRGAPSGFYKILVVNNVNDLVDSVVFMLSEPKAVLTGEYRDHIDKQGNLIVEARVKVDHSDRFYLQASLYTSLGDPIGSTQTSLALAKGSHWVPLEFYGLMVQHSGLDGPYVLKNISLARVTMPMQSGPLQHPDYSTQAYERDQFTNQSFNQKVNVFAAQGLN